MGITIPRPFARPANGLAAGSAIRDRVMEDFAIDRSIDSPRLLPALLAVLSQFQSAAAVAAPDDLAPMPTAASEVSINSSNLTELESTARSLSRSLKGGHRTHTGPLPSSTQANDQGTIALPPSVLSGRPQQYTLGDRFVAIPLSCSTCDDEDNCTWYPIEIDAALTNYSSFGGHAANPHDIKPIGRLEWGTQSSGDFTPPPSPETTDPHPTLSVTGTPSEQIAETKLKITLPEAAQESLFELSVSCPDIFPDNPVFDWTVVIRTRTDVPLQRLINIDSANGKGRLVIERSSNSHGQDAGYASSATASSLQILADSYGFCPINASLPEGEQSALTITGVALPEGGLYDIYLNWMKPHRNHRAGEDTDIGLSPILSDEERLECLNDAVADAGLTMPVSSEALVEDPETGDVYATGNHIHLWSSESTPYPQDLTPEFMTQLACIVYGVCS